jgi:glutamate/aspartate transport system substrate-binding protein
MRASLAILLSAMLAAGFAVEGAQADTIATIRSRGALVIGYREGAPPFSSADAQNRPQGYSIDLCNRIADSVKSVLGLGELQVRYVPVTAENRIDKLESGEIDIECGSTTRTLSRQARVDFTLFTFLTGAEMLVRADSDISGPNDLDGKKIAVQPDTTTEKAIKRVLSESGRKAEIVSVRDSQAGFAALEAGSVDAYASDEVVLIGLAKASKNPRRFRLTGQFYSYEPYALMVRKNDADFRLIADRTLALVYQDGEIIEIWRRWFGDWAAEPPVLLRAMYAIESLVP